MGAGARSSRGSRASYFWGLSRRGQALSASFTISGTAPAILTT